MEKVFCDYFEADKFPARMTSTTEIIDPDCLMMIDGVRKIRLKTVAFTKTFQNIYIKAFKF